jgi:hypothetical protein
MGDSAHLVEYVMNQNSDHVSYGLVHDVAGTSKPRRLPVPPASRLPELRTFVAVDNRILTACWRGRDDVSRTPTDSADTYESAIGHETEPEKRYSILLPAKAEIWDQVFSPRGDRIVWPLVQDHASAQPVARWLHRWIPAFSPPSEGRMSIWVSRIDGSQMHEIGFVPIELDSDGDLVLNDMPEDVRWLPDGNHLCFRLKTGLYVVPAK